MKKFLENVYGNIELKQELKLIKDWYFDDNKDKSHLPKGILLYGNPGVGKTFIIKEYAKEFDWPIFILKGDEENLLEEVSKIYEKARRETHAIILIDEIDKLLVEDYKLARILQSELDGFEQNNCIITLATANDKDELPDPLLRQGRFDRVICLNNLDKKDIKALIIGFINELKATLSDDEVEELSETFIYKTPCLIKSCISDAYFRNNQKVSVDAILSSFDLIENGSLAKFDDELITKQISIHEAGHALYLYKYSKNKKFLRVKFNIYGGRSICTNINRYESVNSRMDTIRCSLAGIVAEELINKNHDLGCSMDLENCYDLSSRLLARTCIKNVTDFINGDEFNDKGKLTYKNHDQLRHKTKQFVRKQYRHLKVLFRKDKSLLIKISDYIYKNHHLNRNELMNICK